jgi:hypothetical protein
MLAMVLFILMRISHYSFLQNEGWWVFSLCLISIIVCWRFLPARGYHAFCHELLPLLSVIKDYSFAMKYKYEANSEADTLYQKKYKIINILQSTTQYPEWVFDFGFNPGLRAGYRFFLIKIEWVTEILFSLHYLFEKIDVQKIFVLQDNFLEVISKNNELLEAIIHVFSDKPMINTSSDYMADIDQLEKSVYAMLPRHLELLVMTPDEELLASLLRHMKDLRKLLLELASALPKRSSQ